MLSYDALAWPTLEEWALKCDRDYMYRLEGGGVITMGFYKRPPQKKKIIFPMLMVRMFCLGGGSGDSPLESFGKFTPKFCLLRHFWPYLA